MDIWQLEFARGEPTRLTFNPGHDMFPVWSPDATRIAFTSLRDDGAPQIYELDSKSPGHERILLKSNLPASPSGWSRDGRIIVYTVTDPTNGGDVWALPLGHEPYPVVATAADERYGSLSPDGHWLAYISNQSGAYEVYVRAFPGPGLLRQVSTHGGFQPQWRNDARELFYVAADRMLMTLPVSIGAGTLEAGPPTALFATRAQWIEIQATARNFAAAPDGQRFLVSNATEEARFATTTVMLNWNGLVP
jgi:serine/threonine-protein kinase